MINEFISENNIYTIAEFGCGDGNQASLLRTPTYVGFDVSPSVVRLCKDKISDPNKSFYHTSEYQGTKFDLILSLDVIYHLIEDNVFYLYMLTTFSAASHYVCIYSTNYSLPGAEHIKHRVFTDWIEQYAPTWTLKTKTPNKYPEFSAAEFYFYTKTPKATPYGT